MMISSAAHMNVPHRSGGPTGSNQSLQRQFGPGGVGGGGDRNNSFDWGVPEEDEDKVAEQLSNIATVAAAAGGVNLNGSYLKKWVKLEPLSTSSTQHEWNRKYYLTCDITNK